MKGNAILFASFMFVLITGFNLPRTAWTGNKVQRWVISKNSSLSVNGRTNVNKFSCAIPDYDKVDTLVLTTVDPGRHVVLSGSIGLSISTFDCHNSGMTKQLRKTLEEKQFPLLRIKFLSLSQMPVLTATPEAVTGLVDIEIAGVSKRFEVNYQITQNAQKSIQLLGTRDINFSDFNLIPPSKLGGMIKTKNQLSVAFTLLIKAMD
jgi:hypothetical protein